MEVIIKIIGAVGLFLIIIGVVQKQEKQQDYYFTFGGLCLLAYSAWLKDPIFIPLQIVFIAVAVWELWNMRKKHQ